MSRNIMMLKGLTFGIPEAKYEEAFEAATKVIKEQGITTICWDGDKYTYQGKDGAPPTGSFTRLLVTLREKMPHLEFIYFKKEGKAKSLRDDGMEKPKADDHGNVLGPFPFLTPENTKILKSTDAAPPVEKSINYGIEFSGIPDRMWWQLGLKGLVYIKDVLGLPSVTYMVFGLGGAVGTELEEVAKDPSKYPAGITEEDLKIIEVVRPRV